MEQWEKLRDGASSEVVLHDVMRIQIDRLRGELDELRSDYEALFKERKVLQSMIQDVGAGGSDSAQLAVELAQAHDALGSLQEERTHLLRQLLEQQRAQYVPCVPRLGAIKIQKSIVSSTRLLV